MALRIEKARVLAFSCLHFPYQHPAAVDFLARVARKLKPTHIVNLGDEIDGHAVSRFHKDPDLFGASEELRESRKGLARLGKMFPNVSCCVSNHTWRAYVRAHEAGIPAAYLRSIGDVLGTPPGWRWSPSVEIASVLFLHGEGYSGEAPYVKAAERNRRSTVIGHVHTACGTQHLYGPADKIFGMSVGCLIDPRSAAFAYARTTPRRPALGCGIIVGGVPTFVPMEV